MIWVHCPHINIDQGGLLYAGKHISIIPWLSNSHMFFVFGFTITYPFIIFPSLFRHIYWRNAFPLYGCDYSSVLEAIEKMETNLPGFFYAGKPNKCLILEFLMLIAATVFFNF
jgi:hypothetical protein